MQVKEILRVKGSRSLSIEPAGTRRRRGGDDGEARTSARWWSWSRAAWWACSPSTSCCARSPRAAARSATSRSADIMVRDPVTAAPDMEVNDLRRTMLESGARYLPVMQDGKLLGVISFRDVAKAVLEEQDFENKMLKGYIKNWPA